MMQILKGNVHSPASSWLHPNVYTVQHLRTEQGAIFDQHISLYTIHIKSTLYSPLTQLINYYCSIMTHNHLSAVPYT